MAKKATSVVPVNRSSNKSLWADEEIKHEAAMEIIRRVANGETLTKVCKDPEKNYPSPSNFLGWVNKDPFLQNQYARALQIRADINAETIVDIADDDANVARARNRIDARRWHNEKLAPKKYGAKVLAENTTNLNISQRIDFTMIPQQVREQLRRAVLKQIEKRNDD